MNVLLTSVGRRSYLVEYFKAALAGSGRVIGVNSSLASSGMALADRCYQVPLIDSPDYVPRLMDICRQEGIGLLMSLFDIDLPKIAQNREEFEALGVAVAVSDPWVVEAANDKWRTYCLLREHGLGTPKTFLGISSAREALEQGMLSFPLIIKPRCGMGSIGVFSAETAEELEFFYRYSLKNIKATYLRMLAHSDPDQNVLVQERIVGTEYGVDVLNDLAGHHMATVVKRKLEMRSGETDIAISEDHAAVKESAEVLGRILRHRGNLDIDVMLDAVSGKPKVIEFNARFGGGYPFSHLAGVDFPAALIAAAEGRPAKAAWLSYTRGVQSCKALSPIVLSR